ncbi:hypothetical protein O181_098837 [Austropuccinia psidii MF-1]|uniref:Uncharacterized protein n=1 Tax=Austropuccinia psidii MF-1 TaxID=1389203 RepID=A0A9Q3JB76_9BASI|nr:hypothetical protein [Austropuccinia psidii MF-1]
MSHTLTYHSIQNVQLSHHHVQRGIGPYAHAHAPAPTWALAHAHTHTYGHAPAHENAHANETTPHLQYCGAALPVSSAKAESFHG